MKVLVSPFRPNPSDGYCDTTPGELLFPIEDEYGMVTFLGADSGRESEVAKVIERPDVDLDYCHRVSFAMVPEACVFEADEVEDVDDFAFHLFRAMHSFDIFETVTKLFHVGTQLRMGADGDLEVIGQAIEFLEAS